MSETAGQQIDKLLTVDLKMWHNQEILYAIRRMSFDEFLSAYAGNENMLKLFTCLKKCCDLNVQRNMLMEGVDRTLIALIRAVGTGATDEDLAAAGFIQTAHKTY